MISARSALGWIAIQAWAMATFVGCSDKASNSTPDAVASPDVGSGGAFDMGGNAGAGSGGSGGVGGTGGVGGAGGGGIDAAGSGGGADAAVMDVADGAAAGSCVQVSGGGDAPWYNLTVAGTQFNAYEGARMRIAVATQTGNRVGIGELPIVGGAFTVSMPQVLNSRWYVGITLYVDKNRNATCETDEHVWDWTTKIVTSDMRFDVTPDELCDRTLMHCRPRTPTQQACWVGSGDTDLRQPLPCTP